MPAFLSINLQPVSTELPLIFKLKPPKYSNAVKKINRLISVETGQAMEKVESDTKRNFWMSAEEALKYGLVRKIIQTSDDLKV